MKKIIQISGNMALDEGGQLWKYHPDYGFEEIQMRMIRFCPMHLSIRVKISEEKCHICLDEEFDASNKK